jgi:acyl-CoA reductase-like NAD-dependent aldehyde dehydrogenase
MDSLQRKRLYQRLLLAGTATVLVLLLVLNTFRASPEEREEAEVTQLVLQHDPENMQPEERERLREQWARLPEESRQRVFRAVAASRLDEFRQQTKTMNQGERQQLIQRRIVQMRQQRARLTSEQRRELGDELSREEAREVVGQVLSFYQDELSARERAELDPLVHEWIYHIESLVRNR